jgi:hypothetical protein
MEIDTLALCSAPSRSFIVGVSLAVASKEPPSIFATFQHHGIHQYDVRRSAKKQLVADKSLTLEQIQEQRSLQSWLIPSDAEITLAAAQHPVSGARLSNELATLVPGDVFLTSFALFLCLISSGDLYCAQDGRIVLGWSKATLNADQWHRRKVRFGSAPSCSLFVLNGFSV